MWHISAGAHYAAYFCVHFCFCCDSSTASQWINDQRSLVYRLRCAHVLYWFLSFRVFFFFFFFLAFANVQWFFAIYRKLHKNLWPAADCRFWFALHFHIFLFTFAKCKSTNGPRPHSIENDSFDLMWAANLQVNQLRLVSFLLFVELTGMNGIGELCAFNTKKNCIVLKSISAANSVQALHLLNSHLQQKTEINYMI